MTNYLQLMPSSEHKSSVTYDQARAIWLEAKQKHVELLIKTLWFTGLRITEALGITGGSLTVDAGEYSLTVTREKQVRRKRRKKNNIALTLTEKLPIPRELGLDLREFITRNNIGVAERLFPRHRATYWRQVQQCARSAGLPNWQDIHPHSFRHGFIYDKASKNVHPFLLARLAGHKNVRTTLGYYEPTDRDIREAMER